MVLKCIEMSSDDWFYIHENKCLAIKGVRLSNGYLGLDNENVYSIHTLLVNPLVILLSFFLYKKYLFSVPGL